MFDPPSEEKAGQAEETSRAQVVQPAELQRASRRLGTELRGIRLMIERTKATNPMTYPRGFRLPLARWEEYEALLANHADLYESVERAYAAAIGVNDVLHRREARGQSAGFGLAVNTEDGLDRAHGLAGEALDALGEVHNAPFEPQAPAEPRAPASAPYDPVMRRRTEILVEQIGDDRETRAEARALIKRGFALRGEIRKPSIREMTDLAKDIHEGSIRDRIERWCNDSRGFIQAYVHAKVSVLMSEDRESELLNEWTRDAVIAVIDDHLSMLKRVMDSTPPTRLG
jgi:hypothetical protein